MLLCRKDMTVLQRRSMQRVSGVLMLTVVTNFLSPSAPNPLVMIFPGVGPYLAGQRVSLGIAGLLSALSLLPIVLAVWIAADYLKSEADEFVRMIVVRALLWGFAVTMAGDAVLSVLMMLYKCPFPLTLFNADLFIASTGIAFRLLRRSYQ